MEAAFLGNLELGRVLLDEGADVNAESDVHHDTALHAAADLGMLEFAGMLIQRWVPGGGHAGRRWRVNLIGVGWRRWYGVRVLGESSWWAQSMALWVIVLASYILSGATS